MSDKDELAEVLDQATSKFGTGFWAFKERDALVDSILTSDWSATHDREVARRAWDEGQKAERKWAYAQFLAPKPVNPYLPPVTLNGEN